MLHSCKQMYVCWKAAVHSDSFTERIFWHLQHRTRSELRDWNVEFLTFMLGLFTGYYQLFIDLLLTAFSCPAEYHKVRIILFFSNPFFFFKYIFLSMSCISDQKWKTFFSWVGLRQLRLKVLYLSPPRGVWAVYLCLKCICFKSNLSIL